jgi:hypothetical protein
MTTLRSASSYVLAYAMWAGSLILAYLSLFMVRMVVLSAIAINTIQRADFTSAERFYAALEGRAAEAWSFFGLGIVLVIVLVYLEYLYRTSVPRGQLLNRFLLVTTIELGILFCANLIYYILIGIVDTFSWTSAYSPIIELVALGLCLWLRAVIKNQPRPAAAP